MGVFSIIVVMTAMRVMQNSIESQLSSLGNQTCRISKWPERGSHCAQVIGHSGFQRVSPATSQTNTNWQSVNGGDGGYNEIDPVNSNNWYTANTDISIQRCASGAAA